MISEKDATRIITDLNGCCDIKDRQIERLEREADWLAEQLSRMIDDCPTAKAKSYCYKAPYCVDCWRDAARKAVQND